MGFCMHTPDCYGNEEFYVSVEFGPSESEDISSCWFASMCRECLLEDIEKSNDSSEVMRIVGIERIEVYSEFRLVELTDEEYKELGLFL